MQKDAKQRLATRKQLWEIDTQLLCSVCGTCLSMEEQRRLLRKLDIYEEKDYSDYEVHSLMRRYGEFLNKLSYQVNKLLNQKYQYEIARYARLSEEEYRDVWKEHYARGDVCGLYWVAVTHRGLTESFVQKTFCDIHMLSHLHGGENRKEKAERRRLEEENRKLQQKLLYVKRLRKEQEQELAASNKRLQLVESKLSVLEKSVESEKDVRAKAVPCEPPSARRLKEEIGERRRELEQALGLIQDLSRDKEDLSRKLAYQQKVNQQLYEEFQRVLKELPDTPPVCQKTVREANQFRRRILMVGGVSRLSSICQEMVENMGHEFTYHDGYMNSGADKLKSLIQNVDMVLCSTDCNSHGACQSVKKICKRLKKDCRFLSSTSLSSIFRVVKGINEAKPESTA
jgi:hypothetical protein